ncbi:MAG: sigma-70 family RNA polymerase sigma factor [Planctomycetota bacterium]
MEAADASDVRIIREVQAGHREAFESLVRKYMRRAHGIAMQFVQNSEDALDLSQDAFLKTFKAMDRFDTDQRFFPWFYRILRNTCLTFLKRKGLVRSFSLSSPAEGEPDYQLVDEASVPPHAVLVGGELRQEFWKAYTTLSLRDREILTLRHFQEQSYQEIADTLGIPIGTVMSRLYHARRKLRDKLESYL